MRVEEVEGSLGPDFVQKCAEKAWDERSLTRVLVEDMRSWALDQGRGTPELEVMAGTLARRWVESGKTIPVTVRLLRSTFVDKDSAGNVFAHDVLYRALDPAKSVWRWCSAETLLHSLEVGSERDGDPGLAERQWELLACVKETQVDVTYEELEDEWKILCDVDEWQCNGWEGLTWYVIPARPLRKVYHPEPDGDAGLHPWQRNAFIERRLSVLLRSRRTP